MKIVVLFILLIMLGTAAGASDTIDRDKLRTLHAAFVVNFMKFTQWPEGTFSDS